MGLVDGDDVGPVEAGQGVGEVKEAVVPFQIGLQGL